MAKDGEKNTPQAKSETKEKEKSNEKTVTEAKPNMALMVMKKIGTKNLLKVGGGTVGVAVVATVMFPVFGTIMIFGLGVGCLAVLGAVYHAYTVLQKNGIIKPVDVIINEVTAAQKNKEEVADVVVEPAAPTSTIKYKAWDTGSIHVFSNEPSMSDLLVARNTKQEDAEDLFSIEPNTSVNVINDSVKHTVKIRIMSGKHQGRVGWICRSLLVKEDLAA